MVRIFFSVVASKNWPLHQIDINNAFLHGFLNEEIYMYPLEGYSKAREGQVCKLRRSLYGLKQASRQWNLEFTKHLEGFGFKQSHADNCLFLLVYVDDLLISASSETLITELKPLFIGLLL